MGTVIIHSILVCVWSKPAGICTDANFNYIVLFFFFERTFMCVRMQVDLEYSVT